MHRTLRRLSSPSLRGLVLATLAAAGGAQVRPGAPLPPAALGPWLHGDVVVVGSDGAPAATVFVCGSRPATADGGGDGAGTVGAAGYVTALQRRFAARGAVVVVLVAHAPSADELAAWAGCRVVVDAGGRAATAWLGRTAADVVVAGARGDVVFTGSSEAGLVDALERRLDGAACTERAAQREAQVAALRLDLPARFDDATGDIVPALRAALEHAPRDGLLHGLLYVTLATKVNDATAAAAALQAAVTRLADEARPLAAFADLALRGDPRRSGLAATLRPVLEPLAAASPGDPDLQLALLRALVATGDGRAVGRHAMRIRKLVTTTARHCLDFATILTRAADAPVHHDLATLALDRADAIGVAPRLLTAARYGVAVCCARDADAALLLRERYLEADDARVAINNDCWYLMTELATLGRYDEFAAGLAERMLEQRDAMESFEFDTAALAMFLVGRHADAVELQREALTKAGTASPEYRERLARYEAAQASAPR